MSRAAESRRWSKSTAEVGHLEGHVALALLLPAVVLEVAQGLQDLAAEGMFMLLENSMAWRAPIGRRARLTDGA
jgi:hypothetical protein